MRIAILCGGPSGERGISLNSARSLLDHLAHELEIICVYFNTQEKAYQIPNHQLYSNTPSDFDFKLQHGASPLGKEKLVALLRTVDLIFPAIHGAFGEGGKLQQFFEQHQLPFVGTGAAQAALLFDKYTAHQRLKSAGFFSLPMALIEENQANIPEQVSHFFKNHALKKIIVKPATGGSSLGVLWAETERETLEKIQTLFAQGMGPRLVLEPFAQGSEFTVIILQNHQGLPVALPPTEIEINRERTFIFDFRSKYLPTGQVTWFFPPRFSDALIEKIQAQAEKIFTLFEMRDFARFDGWLLNNGEIWFSDFNTISGMEQNSFIFQQCARIGLTHTQALSHIIHSACLRYGLKGLSPLKPVQPQRKKVHVLFGGQSSERQVSLMSGTNVWLKLRNSKYYEPIPFLWDAKGNIWRLPYPLTLSHTVEEITENCLQYSQTAERLRALEIKARLRLGLSDAPNSLEFGAPELFTLTQFIEQSKFVFIALHGGAGEDGSLQALLAQQGVLFNGSTEAVSALCMDKFETAKRVSALKIPGVSPISGEKISTASLIAFNTEALCKLWERLGEKLQATTLIAKPNSDGCSTGVVRLFSAAELEKYVQLQRDKPLFIPAHTFTNQEHPIEMPAKSPEFILFERCVETDVLRVENLQLIHEHKTGWVEMTVAVVTQGGKLSSLNPSITLTQGSVLSVEEKFQGGTGVNITPPPAELMEASTLATLKNRISSLARAIGIEGYARLDIFAHLKTGEILLIEINTLPGLTPSTVLYHQALAEPSPVFPGPLLETLIRNKGY